MIWSFDEARWARRDEPLPLVTLGGWDNVLTFARSLGRRGVPVYSIGAGWNLRLSRFVRWIPPHECGPTAADWLAWLLSDGSRPLRGSFLLPCSDEGADLVARERERLAALYRLPESRPDVVLAMLDKTTTYALAADAGVAAPRIWDAGDRGALGRAIAETEFPCALEPRHSHLFRKRFPGRKVFVADDADELVRRFEETAAAGLRMLVTEIIPGGDDRTCSYGTWIDDSGRSLFHYTKKKPRQYPIHFGLGTLHSSEWLPDVAALGRRFLMAVGMRGPAAVEFKRDPRDGRLKLIECNPRIAAATYELAERSGVDLAWAVYAHATGAPAPELDDYRDGVQVWSPLHDGKAFLQYRRAGELSAWRWIRSIARSRCHVAQFRWSDPLPALGFACRVLRPRWSEDDTPPRRAPAIETGAP